MSALDARQMEAVMHRGSDLSVVAGAGSGKTRVLTERIVRRVVEDGVPLERIAAITFTERAAAEMKERLGRALAAGGVPNAAEEVDRAAISTVHAYCARLLREHAVEAGVDPGFEVLDEVQSDVVTREALAALAAELAREQPQTFARVARTLGGDADERMLALYEAARASGRPFDEFLEPPADIPDITAARADVAAAAAVLVTAKAGASVAMTRRADAALGVVRGLPWGTDEEAVAVAARAAAASIKLPGAGAADVNAALAAVRSALYEMHGAAAEAWIAPHRRELAGLLTRLRELHDEIKGNGARLDFADLELRALELLSGAPDLQAEIAARRTDLLVDEYQDTNPIQSRLVELLRRDGSLFVVGDPKQSIYGFRGADVEVFLERTEREGTARVDLSVSYRARPALLAFVNALFDGGVSRGAPELGVRPVPFRPLVAARPAHADGGPRVETALLANDTLIAARIDEARWIADRIVALTAGETPLRVRSESPENADGPDGAESTRPAAPGDVAILLRAMTHVKLIERALTERDVPYTVVKGRGFYEAREVVDLANLLSCVDCAADDLRMASVLRSPSCGLDDESLFRLTSARGGRTLSDVVERVARGDRDAPSLTSGAARRLVEFVSVFAELRRVRGRVPLAELVDRSIRATDHDLIVLARPSGRQRLANLRKIQDMARAADDSGGVPLAIFVDRLRQLRQREVRETEAPIAGAGAVSVMTVHQAKGLEFPLVFVPDMARAHRHPSSGLECHAQDGVGLLPDLPWGPVRKQEARPLAFRRIRAANAARDDAESMRLLYVAVTRASEHLVLTAAVSSSSHNAKRPWWDRVIAVAPCAGDAALVLAHAAAAPPSSSGRAVRSRMGDVSRALVSGRAPGGNPGDRARAEARDLMTIADRAPPRPSGALFESTVSAVMTYSRCPIAFRRRHVLGIPESLDLDGGSPGISDGERPFRPGDDDEIGSPLGRRALGRAVHLALERLVPAFDGDIEQTVRDALRSETRGAPPGGADVARVVQWTKTFRDSDLGDAVRGLPRDRVRREQSILVRAGPTILRGQVDLLFRTDEGWVIVDYKAGAVDGAARAYAVQMQLYGLALSRIDARPPARATLFSLPDGTTHDVDVTRPALDELERGLVQRFLDATRDEDYRHAPGDATCELCGHRG